MKPNDENTWLTNVTLDAWDEPGALIRVCCIVSKFAWFGFGRFLGYRAVVTDGLLHAYGDICNTPRHAVRSAVENLIEERSLA